MDCGRQPPADVAASVASVLGDDDLFREILLRLGFATFLVRASLVSRRWLTHTSSPRFLRSFRERNPPHLLGFCISSSPKKFVLLPQPLELSALSRRVASSYDDAFARKYQRIRQWRNGRLIIQFFHEDRVKMYQLSLLLAEESAFVLPPAPPPHLKYWRRSANFTEIFPPEDRSRGSISLVRLWKVRQRFYAEVNFLGPSGWGNPVTATEIELPHDITILTETMLPPIHGKVFVVTIHRCILGLDLASARLFILELPDGVERNYMLSRAEDFGLYLVNANGFQLSKWIHTTSGNNGDAGGWLLMDTFCIHEACTRLAGDGWVHRGNILDVVAVEDNADFVILDHKAAGVVFYDHLKSRAVEKVHEKAGDATRSGRVLIPTIMTPWPPIFPAQNVGLVQEE
jgi:hypothetical protein